MRSFRSSFRSWFTEERASDVAPTYTNQILGQAFEAVRGIDGIKSTAAFRGSLTLIGHAAGVASLSGQHSGALQGHLSTIARSMVDIGESNWLINVGSTGAVELLPCAVVDVRGGPAPATWLYQMTVQGPTEMATVQRPGESILSFKLRVDPRSPWRGRPAIDATGTGQLLAQLEKQLRDEAKVAPARVLTGGGIAGQAGDISDTVKAGGIVTLIQAIASREDPSGVRAGTIKNEVSASSVALHEQLERAICGVLGCPPDLVLGGSSESGSRESMRRFGSTTINNILTTIATEWVTKMGTDLVWDLDRLRASDEVSRARAVGSRANAVSRLVDSGLPLDQAMAVVGID